MTVCSHLISEMIHTCTQTHILSTETSKWRTHARAGLNLGVKDLKSFQNKSTILNQERWSWT